MVLKTHGTKPLKQFFPIIFPLLFGGLSNSSSLWVSLILHIRALFTVSTISVSSVSVPPSVCFYSFLWSIVSIFPWNLRFVIFVFLGWQLVMDFFFNRMIRSKPPLDGIQRSSWWSSMCYVIFLSRSMLPSIYGSVVFTLYVVWIIISFAIFFVLSIPFVSSPSMGRLESGYWSWNEIRNF